MRQRDAITLFDHVYWMRDRILDAADDDAIPWHAGGGVTVRGLRATLVHELDVEWSWRERLSSDDPTRFGDDADLVASDYPSVAALREHWLRDEAAMRTWLQQLDDERLSESCRAEANGDHPFWFHLQHLYSHAVQQFGDAAVELTRSGRSPGELDFLEFVRTNAR